MNIICRMGLHLGVLMAGVIGECDWFGFEEVITEVGEVVDDVDAVPDGKEEEEVG